MRTPLLVAIALVVAACSIGSSPSVSTEAGKAVTTAPTTSTTTVPSTTTTTLAPEAEIATETLRTVGCDQADDDFDVLCEVIDLIEERYVDDVSLEALSAGAVRGVEQFARRDVTDAPLTCAIPHKEFVAVCEALDDADTTPVDGVEAAIDGMVGFALDPNSAYLNPQALSLAVEDQTGSVEGIGALVNTEDRTTEDPPANPCAIISETCRMVIVSTLAGSPAEAAGVEAGDELVTVDGVDVIGLSLDEVTTRVRGPAGTDVRLEFLRRGEAYEVVIERAAVEIPIASWEMVGSTGYLQLNLFTDNSVELVEQALGELLGQGADRVVLDLRNNPGGSLDSSVRIASQFLAAGSVVITESPESTRPYEVVEGGVATDVRLVVLVNRGSASASEVVSGALKEAGRATVIGENTFGKNTVQQRFSLSNGGAIKLTIARWVTPSGSDFGEQGITPDIEAEIPLDLSPEEIVALVNTLVS